MISRAQYLDLVYTQSCMLYDKIPNALRISTIVPQPPRKESHARDGVTGSGSSQSMSKPSSSTLVMTTQNPSSTPPTSCTSKANFVQSNKGKSQQQQGSKKKGKVKKNKYYNPQDKQNTPYSNKKLKTNYPCLMCNKPGGSEPFPEIFYFTHYAELNLLLH